MTRTDTVVVGTLVALLAHHRGADRRAGHPARGCPERTVAIGGTGPSFEVRPYVEGVLGRPSSVSPLTARTQADRDLVALLFPGLVRNGPGGTIVPDLAERWSVDKAGKTWTVDIRPDARWHDGSPVTSDDVVFTIETLQDPAYTGPSATSWSEVTVSAVTPHQVRFTLDTPLGGFLQALTQPIAPATCSATSPSIRSTGRPVRRAADRIGRVRDHRAERHLGVADPGARSPRTRGHRRARPRARRPTRCRPPSPTEPADSVRCRTSPASSSASTTPQRSGGATSRSGELDAASRVCRRRWPRSSASQPGARLVRYPGCDADGGARQPAAGPPGVRDRRRSGPGCSPPSTATASRRTRSPGSSRRRPT